MANEWNTSYPIDHTKIGDVPGEIRKLKDSTKDQLSLEHEAPVDGDATGSEHSSGSAVAFEGTSTPTARPGGAALADNAIGRGRLWLDDNGDPPNLKLWTGAAFTESVRALGGFSPAAFIGGESITFPNNMILKQGNIAWQSTATITVTFATAFPTAGTRAFLQVVYSAASITAVVVASSLSKTALQIKTPGETATSINWFVIGY